MTSVPPTRLPHDEAWRELEAALSIAYAALTDARALAEQLDAPQPLDAQPGLRLAHALKIILSMLDAFLDAPAAEGER